jgi:hypothetical protein
VSNEKAIHPSNKDAIVSTMIPKIDQSFLARYHNSLMFKYDIDVETECAKSRLTSVQPLFVLKYELSSKILNKNLLKSVRRYFWIF